ncbi:hypothetical protein HK102_004302 [Quaeritorhiza haematococci]|nr:hypothetical protein HK102_004302 [Quaeritorhiza haematococci]
MHPLFTSALVLTGAVIVAAAVIVTIELIQESTFTHQHTYQYSYQRASSSSSSSSRNANSGTRAGRDETRENANRTKREEPEVSEDSDVGSGTTVLHESVDEEEEEEELRRSVVARERGEDESATGELILLEELSQGGSGRGGGEGLGGNLRRRNNAGGLNHSDVGEEDGVRSLSSVQSLGTRPELVSQPPPATSPQIQPVLPAQSFSSPSNAEPSRNSDYIANTTPQKVQALLLERERLDQLERELAERRERIRREMEVLGLPGAGRTGLGPLVVAPVPTANTDVDGDAPGPVDAGVGGDAVEGLEASRNENVGSVVVTGDMSIVQNGTTSELDVLIQNLALNVQDGAEVKEDDDDEQLEDKDAGAADAGMSVVRSIGSSSSSLLGVDVLSDGWTDVDGVSSGAPGSPRM